MELAHPLQLQQSQPILSQMFVEAVCMPMCPPQAVLFLVVSLFSWLFMIFLIPSVAPKGEWLPFLPGVLQHICSSSAEQKQQQYLYYVCSCVPRQIVHQPCMSLSGSPVLSEIFLLLAAEVVTALPLDSSTLLPLRLTCRGNSSHHTVTFPNHSHFSTE